MGLFLCFTLVCILGAKWLNHSLHQEMIKQQVTKLDRELELLEKNIDFKEMIANDQVSNLTESQTLKKALGAKERLTIINQSMQVVLDTENTKKIVASGSRKQRPEVAAVTSGKSLGYALRNSTTIGEKLLYVAKPIKINGKIIGIVRISEKYSGFSEGAKKLETTLLFFVGSLLLLLFLFLSLLIYQRNEPMRKLIPLFDELSKDPTKRQLIVEDATDWLPLYDSANQLMKETHTLSSLQSASEMKLRFFLENLAIGVVMINEEAQVTTINPKCFELLQEEAIKPPFHYQEIIKNAQILQLLHQARSQKQDQHEEVRVIRPQSKDLDVLFRYLKPNNQGQSLIIGIFYDLSQIRQLERMQQDFVANVSHELKTPVTSILGFTETLLDGAQAEPEIRQEFLTIIQKEAGRLQEMIQKILLLSRNGDTFEDIEEEVLSIADILKTELDFYQQKIEEKSLVIECDNKLEKDRLLPARYMQPIIKNLLENAIYYNENQGKIKIRMTQTAESFCFSVQDNGVGISEKDQERIFERFYRVSRSRNRNAGGSGLGLAIVKHYVDLLKGQIEIESRLGLGTTIKVRIPVQ